MLLPQIVDGSHHGHVPLHTHQTEEQWLCKDHRPRQERCHRKHIQTLPQKVIGEEQKAAHIEEQLCDRQVEGEEVCGKDTVDL